MEAWKQEDCHLGGLANLDHTAYPLVREFTINDLYLSVYGVSAIEWDRIVMKCFANRGLTAPPAFGFRTMAHTAFEMIRERTDLFDASLDMLTPRRTTDKHGRCDIRVGRNQLIKGCARPFEVGKRTHDRVIPAYLLVPFLYSIMPQQVETLCQINSNIIDHYSSWYERYNQTVGECPDYYKYLNHELQHVEAADATARQCAINIGAFKLITKTSKVWTGMLPEDEEDDIYDRNFIF